MINYENYSDLCRHPINSLSVGKMLALLIDALSNDYRTATGAIDSFMAYWNCLDDRTRKVGEWFKINNNTPSLATLIEHLKILDTTNADDRQLVAEELLLILDEYYAMLYEEGRNDKTFIKKAIEHFDKLKMQLPLGFDGCHCGETPLMTAVWWDRIDVVNVILENTSDFHHALNTKNASGTTPLMLAVGKGRLDMVRLLVEKDSSEECINIKNRYKNTALMLAAGGGHSKIVKFILDKNSTLAVINARNEYGCTPLIQSAGCGYIENVRYILEKNSSLAIMTAQSDTTGNIPLTVAIFKGYTEIAKIILDKTSDLEVLHTKNKAGNTPLMMARLKGNLEIETLILKKISDLETRNVQKEESEKSFNTMS